MGRQRRAWWVIGLAIAAIVVVVLAPLASGDPDGLERVGEDVGFIEQAQDAVYEILPDYTVPGIEDPVISTIVSGLIGVAVVFVIMVALGRVLRSRRAA
jgi:hypothetical protein